MRQILLALLLLPMLAGAQNSTAYTDLIKQANDLYYAKQYRQAGDAFTRAFAINGGGTKDDVFNAACVWSLAGNSDSAFSILQQLVTRYDFKGYNHLLLEPDLDPLHEDQHWASICAMVKQNRDKESSHLNKPLVAMLDTIFQDDQRYRLQLPVVGEKYGPQSKEIYALRATIERYDSINTMKISALLDKYGWLGPDVVGTGGSQTEFYVIQHARQKIQDKYLPIVRKAVKDKQLDPGLLALLEDRLALKHGGKQLYGSQIWADVDGKFVAPVEDPDRVDKRRADVGLEPLAEYLKNFGMTWDLQQYKAQQPAIKKRAKNITID